MALATVNTRAQQGFEAPAVKVEVHLSGGLPGLHLVGLAETAVKESRERVRAALRQSGFEVPQRKITVNLAPADLPKRGSRYDLAIAVGILAASGQVPVASIEALEFFGELALSGAVRRVPGLLPAIHAAGLAGHDCIVPLDHEPGVDLLERVEIFRADHLLTVVRHLRGDDRLSGLPTVQVPEQPCPAAEDFADVRGQSLARRALEVAAAGGHNILMSGPPGTGKTMLARRLPGILPSLDRQQLLEIAMIESIAGQRQRGRARIRPFRAPHHTSSAIALVGGGRVPGPGEISLAHHGVLFLDELPEFPRAAIEALREPLESGFITVSRVAQLASFPAVFQLVAAMNPCPCGFAGDSQRDCRCSPDQVRRYRQRLSGPLLDRIDIRVALNRESVSLSGEAGANAERSAVIRLRVERACRLQRKRAAYPNARLPRAALREICWPDRAGRRLLERAADRFVLSQRGCDRVLRVAATIRDLEADRPVAVRDVAEALSLQGLGD